METQLVRTDKLMYKVKRFFRMLFIKNTDSQIYEKNAETNLQETTEDVNVYLDKVISCKTEAQEKSIKNQIATKLMRREMSIKEFANEELDNMILFFEQDIKSKTEELESLKKQLIELRNKDKENS